ncbi:hypothetical protein K0M31_018884, partial [Melipona bicolor]
LGARHLENCPRIFVHLYRVRRKKRRKLSYETHSSSSNGTRQPRLDHNGRAIVPLNLHFRQLRKLSGGNVVYAFPNSNIARVHGRRGSI